MEYGDKKTFLFVLLLSLPLLAMIDNKPSGLMQIYVASPNLGIAISLNGNVGIGTIVPKTALDVNGLVRVGRYATAGMPACNSDTLGSFAFDTTNDRPYICASTGWKPLDSDYDKDGIVDWNDWDDTTANKKNVNLLAGNIKKGIVIFGVTGTFEGMSTITSITPAIGTVATVITITGTGFSTGAQVTIGGVVATNVTVVSSTQITVTAPANATSGAKDVTVTNLDTVSVVKMGGFTYSVYATGGTITNSCLLYTSPSPRDRQKSRMPSSA